jgi:hypothetical protein
MNRGPLSNIMGRGRDGTDFEWIVFMQVLVTKLIYWYPMYIAISWMCRKEVKIDNLLLPTSVNVT